MHSFLRVRFFVAIGGLLSTLVVGIAQTGTALVRHAPEIKGTVDGSVQQMLPENVVLSGGASIIDLLVPGTPVVGIAGRPDYGGLIVGAGAPEPLGHKVTISGNARVSHIRAQTDVKPLPPVIAPATPAGTLSVTLSSFAQSVGDFTSVRDLSLTGSVGQVVVPPGAYGVFTANGAGGFTLGVEGSSQPQTYSFERLVLTGTTEIRVLSPVVVVLGAGMSINGVAGSSEHPHWLQFRFAAGGLALKGAATVFANVVAPKGALDVAGASQFVGGLSGDRLIVDGGALVRLVNQPPSISFQTPVDEAVIVAKPVSLEVTATDEDGTIAKVEFYIDGVKFAEAIQPPFAVAWSPPAGSYALTARAYDDLGATSDTALVSVRVLPELPYTTDFEANEGFTVGILRGQQAWVATVGEAIVVDSTFYSGTQSVLLPAGAPPARIEQNFVEQSHQPIVFVDFFIKPVADSDLNASAMIETGAARVGFLRSGSSGIVYGFDGVEQGDGLWRATLAVKPLDESGQTTSWTRVTLREDYTARRWDLYSEGVLVAADLRFRDETKSAFSEFSVRGHAQAHAQFDYFYAGTENPMFVDADRDGIDDDWERMHGMNPNLNDRLADIDGDGVTSVQEYVNGTDPADYYNGDSPVLISLLDQSNQAGALGLVAVKVTTLDGRILRNAPVAFQIESMVAELASIPAGSTYKQVVVRTDQDGIANAYISFSTYALAEIVVSAKSSLLMIGVQPPISDEDDDGLPDLWEATYFGPSGGDPLADADGDGLNNRQEFQLGTSPTDYYNGVLPRTESLVGAGGEIGPDGSISVRVTDTVGNGLPNAPVTFVVKEGGHKLAVAQNGTPLSEITVRADSTGVAKVYVLAGSN